MRLIFFGSGAFGLPTLRALYASRHKIDAVVTQPDKTGRGHHQHENPIKNEAIQRPRPVLQPENVNSPESLAALREFRAEIFVTAAYGQILKPELLAIPSAGAINLHASLLPRHRGAAPIQAAILAGDAETGVTIFRIVPRLDAGPMLAKEPLPIRRDDTAGSLHDRLAEAAVNLTIDTLNALERGEIVEQLQNDQLATYARQMRKEQGEIPWQRPADEIVRHVRAMQPWPGAFGTLETPGRDPLRVHVALAEVLNDASLVPPSVIQPLLDEPTRVKPADGSEPPGTVLAHDEKLLVQTGAGILNIRRLKPAGRREMSAAEFRNGTPLPPGSRFVCEG